MAALQRIAHFQNRRDEVPNQELARDLAAKKDRAGIREIAENVWNKDKGIQADCIKVLYEIGYLQPSLIAEYADQFLRLIKSKNNRLVWGGMTALATVAELKADEVLAHQDEIKQAMREGSVITVDNGVLALARAAARGGKYSKAIFPYLLTHLKNCRPKDVPQHSEKILIAVNTSNRASFVAVLNTRLSELSAGALTRVRKVIKVAQTR